jgi:aminoglycoside phosphotransferase (APT) family kinase protein
VSADGLDTCAAGRLRAWLLAHVDGLADDGELAVEVVSGGASNLTLGVTLGDRRLVVRRPPIGHFLPTAHDMVREHRVYEALRDTPVPVPDARALCEDESVIGTPFYVMERLDGIVPHDPADLAVADPATNRATAAAYVRILCDIHAVDVDRVGLGGLAKRDGYLERQVARWTDQWARSKDVDSPEIDALAARLQRRMPRQEATTLVHGDYRLGNLMLDADDTGRVVAVFDWEMATLGDPLSDLGYALLWWGSSDRPVTHPSQTVADLPGFPTGRELVERYAIRTGRGCDDVAWYMALAAFKLAIIGEGQRARRRRTGGDAEAPQAAQAAQPLAAWALRLTDLP